MRNTSSVESKRGRGQPKYQPTESDRNTIKAMAINGSPHETICKCLGTNGISLKTMYRYFREELDNALNKANAAVASRAYQMAVAGDPPAATFFWLKCRAGWREVERHEITGLNGQPVELSVAKESLARRITSISDRKRASGSDSPAL